MSLPFFSVFFRFLPFPYVFFRFHLFPFSAVFFRFRFFTFFLFSSVFFPLSSVSFSEERTGRHRSRDPFCETPIHCIWVGLFYLWLGIFCLWLVFVAYSKYGLVFSTYGCKRFGLFAHSRKSVWFSLLTAPPPEIGLGLFCLDFPHRK